jgi:hypothetical protein
MMWYYCCITLKINIMLFCSVDNSLSYSSKQIKGMLFKERKDILHQDKIQIVTGDGREPGLFAVVIVSSRAFRWIWSPDLRKMPAWCNHTAISICYRLNISAPRVPIQNLTIIVPFRCPDGGLDTKTFLMMFERRAIHCQFRFCASFKLFSRRRWAQFRISRQAW